MPETNIISEEFIDIYYINILYMIIKKNLSHACKSCLIENNLLKHILKNVSKFPRDWKLINVINNPVYRIKAHLLWSKCSS